MRTAEELKKLAYKDIEPDKAEPSELCFWVRMRYVYKSYAAQLMSKEAACAQTRGAERDFSVMKLWEQCYEKWAAREKNAESAAAKYRKNPTEENIHELLKVLMPELFMRKKNEKL